jgi:FAD:protein FMN transferase
MSSFSFDGTGTIWNIEIYDEISSAKLNLLKERILKLVRNFEDLYSRFLPNSIISSLYGKVGVFNVSEEFLEILSIYFAFNKLTNGQFTPLIGQMLNDIGYDEEYSFKSKSIRNIPVLKDAIELLDNNKIKINLPVELDFGGVGKGFLIDKIYNFLKGEGLFGFCVEGGGDMRISNDELLIENKRLSDKAFSKVGLENPNNDGEVIGVCYLRDGQSICSSSNKRRNWGLYSHIILPEHKMSSNKILASWVVTSCASLADTIATCLFLAEPDQLLKEFEFEYLILHHDFTVEKSEGFECEIFGS